MGWILFAWVFGSELLSTLAYLPVPLLGRVGASVCLKATPPPSFHIRESIWHSLTPWEELVATSYQGTSEVRYRSRFYGRTRLHDNFTLEIGPVDLEDAGNFSALLVDTTGKMDRQAFWLKVYDVVSTPVIQIFTAEKDTNSSAETCTLFLTCTAARGTNVTYSWTGLGVRASQRTEHLFFEQGQVLWVKLDPKEAPRVSYSCTASNAISQESVDIDLRDPCQRRSAAGKETGYGVRDILLIIVPLATFFFLLAALSCLCYKQYSGKKTSYAVAENEPASL